MIMQVLHCPNCQGTDIIHHGKTRKGIEPVRVNIRSEGQSGTLGVWRGPAG